ncbi:arabinan endo-1,5-alpha-L-arabinosidase [Tessaracoccus sp. MC1756]|uniref:arabinan endo-1,5-alpha-L-arabinosidase n=1 Tax=Tessaracoccus sp. MC1756 TaxID=2760311 RepID=UPI001602510A|nr:arabinan endo-1,5-alpha-L-arabinosidase [Tessaracoccus sp. MC1756]MBB1509288.1 arabinan endo-1,5-alpha-L-arabinosidase [Tessaracoccus sp. MC1756]
MTGRWVAGLVAALLVAGCQAGSPVAEELDVSGDLRTHDPGLIVGTEDHPWFVFSTGDPRVAQGAIQVRTSTDGREWRYAGEAWGPDTAPQWAVEKITGVENFWAPEVLEHEGTWYLYYSASTFGSNTSAIGLMTNDRLNAEDPSAGWTDRGEVVSSDGSTDYNAIDPAVLVDQEGQGWMAFGSFWGGIQLVPLDLPSGTVAEGAEPVTIASRQTATNAIEAPALLYRDGWYYLFVSFDSCCRGTASSYNINVGRARSPEGPYLDAEGVDLAEGGGTLLLEIVDNRIGPGGQSVSGDHIAYHYYDADLGGDFQLAIRTFGWRDGWPILRTESETTK